MDVTQNQPNRLKSRDQDFLPKNIFPLISPIIKHVIRQKSNYCVIKK